MIAKWQWDELKTPVVMVLYFSSSDFLLSVAFIGLITPE